MSVDNLDDLKSAFLYLGENGGGTVTVIGSGIVLQGTSDAWVSVAVPEAVTLVVPLASPLTIGAYAKLSVYGMLESVDGSIIYAIPDDTVGRFTSLEICNDGIWKLNDMTLKAECTCASGVDDPVMFGYLYNYWTDTDAETGETGFGCDKGMWINSYENHEVTVKNGDTVMMVKADRTEYVPYEETAEPEESENPGEETGEGTEETGD